MLNKRADVGARPLPRSAGRSETSHIPLSLQQEKIWRQASLAGTVNHVSHALRMAGSLDIAAVARAFNEIVRRHEALRTSYVSEAGVLRASVQPAAPVSVRVTDIEEKALPEALARESAASFDLLSPPLVRCSLWRIADDDHILLVVMHPLAGDAYSGPVFFREMERLCAGTEQALSLQYGDFALWQHETLPQEVLDRDAAFWRDQLKEASATIPLAGRLARRIPGRKTPLASDSISIESSGIDALCRAYGVAPFTAYLAALNAVLFRWTTVSDLIVGAAVDSRGSNEFEPLIGCFANLVPFRMRLDTRQTVSDFFAGAEKAIAASLAHSEIPCDTGVNVGLVVRAAADTTFHIGGAEGSLYATAEPAPGLDLHFVAIERHESVEIRCQYNPEIFSRSTIDALLAAYRDVVRALSADPSATLGSISLPEALSVAGATAAGETIAVAATFTAEPLEEPLSFWMDRLDIPARVNFAPYGQVFQQLLDPASPFRANQTGFNVVLLRFEDWITAEGSLESRIAGLEENIRQFCAAADSAARSAAVPCIICITPPSPEVAASEPGPHLIRLEDLLESELGGAAGTHVITSSQLLAYYPVADYSDPYGESTARIPYTRQMFTAIASMLARRIYGIKAPPFKVLALDCDNTLWKGVCAEDGPLGVVIDAPRIALQEAAIRWQKAGVVLVLCSKNNEEDVWEVFDRNPAMRLRREHIVASRLNWLAKSQNLADLAHELSLGIDSFVFLDDNAIECAEVSANCAGALTMELPADESRIPQFLNHLWALDRWKTTKEDEKRTALYRENLRRETVRRTSSTLDEFLSQLQLEISIEPARPEDLPRASQLTQRTNQFNLTTLRRSESELLQLMGSGSECLVVEVRDRFGDYGKTGVVIYSEKDRAIRIDTFLLSCRVLGRKVEHSILARLGEIALARGLNRVEAPFTPTARNIPARDFLESIGKEFRHEDGDGFVYRFDAAYAAGVKDRAGQTITEAVADENERPPEETRARVISAPLAEIASAFSDVASIQYAIDSASFARRESGGADDAPRTATEEIVAGIWARVLRIPQPGIHSDFFALGGNSLLGAQALARVRQTIGAEIPLRAIFESPTVEGLAARIDAERQRGKTCLPPPSAMARPERIPLSFAQQRLWFIDQLEPGEPLYNIPQVFRIRGVIDVAALERSIQELVRRHESLRTTFPAVDGRPFQFIAPELSVPLTVVPVEGANPAEREQQAEALTIEEARSPFDLRTGPLFRAKLLRILSDQHRLLLTMHHIIGDRWAMGVLAEDLSKLYAAYGNGWPSPLTPLRVQYPDFAIWQRKWLDDTVLREAVTHWGQRLADAPALSEFPADRPRPAVQRHRGSIVTHKLDRSLIDRLTALSQAEGATLFMTMLAVFQALLARYSGQEDVVVGSPIAGRNYTEVEALIGFFVSTMALRANLSEDPSFRTFLGRIREVTLDAYARQDVPFERVVEELSPDRSLSHNPVFQTVFALQNAPMAPLELTGAEVERLSLDWGISLFDLTCFAVHVPDGILLRAEYDSDLFDRQSIVRILGHFENLLRAVVRNPDQPLSALLLLTEAEEHKLVFDWNATKTAWSLDHCVHALFEGQAAARPDALAIQAGDATLSYSELNRRANQLAHKLRAFGVGPETVVAVALDRSASILVAILGVLKAGGAYLPIDISYPAARIAFMLEDSGAAVLLTSQRFDVPVVADVGNCLRLDTDWAEIALESAENLPLLSRPSNLAYVIYTSGSTGKPKGVEVEHRSLINLVRWHQETYQVSATDRATLVASPAFDASVWETWPYLTAGASLHVPEEETRTSPEDILVWLAQEEITLSFLPTPLAERVLDILASCTAPPKLSLRAMLTGGDKLHHAPQRDLGFVLANHYGPTEGTVVSTWTPVATGAAAPPPIGKPIANTRAYILEPSLKPAAEGVPGELYVGGDSLARGYRRRAALTAERFISWRGPGMDRDERLYRTGDKVRYLPSGDIEFFGRLDHQVKVRGFRIELGEIEASLAENPAVLECVVDCRNDAQGAASLVAYVVPRPEGDGTQASSAAEGRSAEQVALWTSTFNDAYKGSGEDDATFNITGWNSSYTGQPIPPGEMRVWVETTVDRILALHPRRVWEIGCGTGLLLYRVAPQTEHYFGIDISQAALDLIAKQTSRPERSLPHVRLQQGPAHEITTTDSDFNVVVLNSVIQYFPSLQYLFDVIRKAVDSIGSEGSIFLGDIRSFPLLELFHVSLQLHQAVDATSKKEFFNHVRTDSHNESELLVDPEFFSNLGQRIPRIGRVEIQLKRGTAHNELTGFRYDVVLTVGKAAIVKDCPTVDWRQREFTPDSLREFLNQTTDDLVVVTGIPNARIIRDVEALRLLTAEDGPATIGDLRAVLAAQTASGVEPEDLWSLEDTTPFHVEIRSSQSPEDGCCDAILRRKGSHAMEWQPAIFAAAPKRSARTVWANNPLRNSAENDLARELGEWLKDRLPPYMAPSAFVILEALPLLASGKLDRKALPAPQPPRTTGGKARTYLEEQIAAIWSAVLRVPEIGIRDDFFALGGHSLLATQVTSRIRELTGVELPVRSLFETPTIAELAERIEAVSAGKQGDLAPIPRVPRDEPLPLSFAQHRLWFLDQLEPNSSLYSAPWALRLKGTVRVDGIEWALNRIVDRHEAFRTVFGTKDHQPVQMIDPAFRLELPVFDISGHANPEAEMTRLALEEVRRPFNLQTGPIFRACLLRIAPEDHVLLLNSHHIANDGWSLWQFVNELGDLYLAFLRGEPSPLTDLPVQYADFAAWQRQWMQGEVLERQVSWWRSKLQGAADTLNLPTDHPRPSKLSGLGATERLQLPPELAAKLHDLSRAENATLFMTLLTAYQVLLFRYTGQEDIVVGAPIANRNRADIERIIGFFVNTIVMRTDLSGAPTFLDVLRRVREYSLEAYTHQDLPFEKLVEALRPERYLDRVPMFQVWFALQNVPRMVYDFPNLELKPITFHTGTSKFDMGLFVTEHPAGLSCMVEYSTDLFDRDRIQRFLGHFATLLESILENPNTKITELNLLTAEEERKQLERNALPASAPRADRCIHEIFEEQVDRAPESIAVIFEDKRLTYAQLNARANQLAHRLRALGGGPESLIGICLDRSPDMLVAILAVLKCGGAYLPLDPVYPPERRAFMLEDARAPILITESRLRLENPVEAHTVVLDEDWPSIAQEPAANLGLFSKPENAAYVIYTSGSTGRPKGVIITHANVVRLFTATDHWFGFGPSDTWSLFHSFAFDFSVWEIWGALLYGGKLVVVPWIASRSPELFHDLLVDHKVTVLNQTPSAFRNLIAADERSPRSGEIALRYVIFGGEALEFASLLPWIGRHGDMPALINMYGITETTVHVTYYNIPTAEVNRDTPSLIGVPIPDLQAYILDDHLHLVPEGVTGQLFIGGAGLAREYLNRPELTADRFIPNPFDPSGRTRLYKTGDLARYREGGNMQYLGRCDQQVKIRGFRIELGEIEATIGSHPGIEQSVVLPFDQGDDDKRLVAYVVPRRRTESQELASAQVAEWTVAFNEAYQRGDGALEATLNLTGWNSSYDGKPIPTEEMRVWVESTGARINALHPKRVWELGCGTGLLLFRVAPNATQYYGTDISTTALDFLKKQLDRPEHRLPHVTLEKRAGHQPPEPAQRFDAVVINSVAQYFPDVDYLVSVLENAIASVDDGGVVFVGDLRNLALVNLFHLSVQVHQATDTATAAEILRRTQQAILQESELLIDQEFFRVLRRRIPRIGRIEIQLKRGRAQNELTRFRYDVVLHIGPGAGVAECPWLNWKDLGLTRERLHEVLGETTPDLLGIAGVPDARLGSEIAAARLLDSRVPPATVADLRALVQESVAAEVLIDPEDIWSLDAELPYTIEIHPSVAGMDGLFDVLFRRIDPNGKPVNNEVVFPREGSAAKTIHGSASNPLRQRVAAQLVPEVKLLASAKLPEYMIPSAIVVLDAIPLSANGKVDRAALPIPGDAASVSSTAGDGAPRNPIEGTLAAVFADVLHLPRVGIAENFFDLGGHSLSATQVVSRARELFRIDVPLRTLFECPTVAALAEAVEQILRNREGLSAPPLTKVIRSAAPPLSFAQQRLWVLDRLDPNQAHYNLPRAVRLKGRLDLDALQRALNGLVERHEVLRTNYRINDDSPFQAVGDPAPVDLAFVDLTQMPAENREQEAVRLVTVAVARPFDLAEDRMFRALLVRLGEEEHVLLVNTHHIADDGWSTSVLWRDLTALYDSSLENRPHALPTLAVQYCDFAKWQRDWLQGEVLENQLSWWKSRLSGAPPMLALPFDHPRPSRPTYRGAAFRQELPKGLSEGIRLVSRAHGVTEFMALLAAFKSLLLYMSKKPDIVLGTDVAGRNNIQTEELIGFFVNVLVLRTDLSGDPSFVELLRQVREVTLGAYAHQDVPFDKLVEAISPERNTGHNPLVQALFVQMNAAPPGPKFREIEASLFPLTIPSKFDLAVFVSQRAEGIRCLWSYNPDLFEESTISGMTELYQQLLESILADPGARIASHFERLDAAKAKRRAEQHQEFRQAGIAKLKSTRRKSVISESEVAPDADMKFGD
ncbi:MAG TPA: amino acid adenylation domain-containing protein [Bryobacteraceae bacterium]|nr:amino acid adenylation domain-containing protein [Bryobacteraceae bacterium]